MDLQPLIQTMPAQAFWFGALSAASLPLGAALGILWKRPSARAISAIMAFGAGSLLAALALELVAPALERGGYTPLAIGAVAGGLLFLLLDWAINKHGGFWRKRATLIRHMVRSERSRMKSRIRHLSEVDVLRRVPTTEMVDLMQYMVRRKLPQGETVFSYGDTADSIFLIDSGKVEVLLPGEPRQVLSDGDSFGTRSFLSEDGRRQSTARTLTAIKAWEVLREDYLRLVERYPSIEQCLVDLNRKRERQCELRRQAQRAKEDLEEALEEVDDLPVHLREVDIEEARRKAGSGAALAIWLGIFLDGLPESAVIGASLLHASLSWALLAGVFLANFPEALSSSASMRQHNAPAFRIMAMWSSLTLTTALGALAGNLFLQEVSHTVYAAFEGMAAGAMLTMIAQTMLPEAYQQGGGLTGICTLLGFLAALAVRAAGG